MLANSQTQVMELGDEPYQFFKKFPHISVAVDAKRKEGIFKLLQMQPKPEVVILDDAFQHRYVQPGLSILLTPYDDLISDDFMVPVGRLREFASGVKRADIVMVTKCTDRTSISEKEDIRLRLKLKNQA
ncbi:tetraacyldisaccharide 4'-kinase, partial [Arthrospira platensis SPKY1]|nr:tetraacyldisaccharide 4'-kinase [Arthrospira platensis SPKY1]